MTQNSSNEAEKRQKALERLRERRGAGRTSGGDRREAEVDAAKLLIKGYRKQRSLGQDIQPIEEITTAIADSSSVPLIDTLEASSLVLEDPEEFEEQVPELQADAEEVVPRKITKVSKRLAKQDQAGNEALDRLKKILQARRARQKQVLLADLASEESEIAESEISDSASLKISGMERQQLLSSILSTDFLQNATQWLSSAPTDPELTSSSLEEIEALYKQSKYRYKVLSVLMDASQKELEAIELYMRNYQIWQSQTQ